MLLFLILVCLIRVNFVGNPRVSSRHPKTTFSAQRFICPKWPESTERDKDRRERKREGGMDQGRRKKRKQERGKGIRAREVGDKGLPMVGETDVAQRHMVVKKVKWETCVRMRHLILIGPVN